MWWRTPNRPQTRPGENPGQEERKMTEEYRYGVTYLKPTRRAAQKMDKIAREEGGPMGGLVEVNVTEGRAPGINHGRYQGWFVGPSRGEPFDLALARRVADRVALLLRAGGQKNA